MEHDPTDPRQRPPNVLRFVLLLLLAVAIGMGAFVALVLV